jgi:rhamnulose-1-phosphate aldolase/alcohol dehydrogenase
LERLRNLRSVYRGLAHEDEMVELFNHCIYDLQSKAPSIDTPLHGFLPFKHIDHLHPDAAIAIAAAKHGESLTRELFDGRIGWVDWQRPGFDLGLKLLTCLQENKSKGVDLQGIMLGSHGLFTWGDTAYDSYLNTLKVIEQCAAFVQSKEGKNKPVFGGSKLSGPAPDKRVEQAAAIMPLLRGLCSSEQNMVGHYSADEKVLQFINSNDLERLAPMGTSCPDHFLRTKISPLLIPLPPEMDVSSEQLPAVKTQLKPVFEAYRNMYADYYKTCRRPNSPAMRDPNPVVLLWPGIGMFTFAKDKQTARVAAEFYTNAINVMRGAEAISEYTSLPRTEAFDIEYWLLEEAKLQRMPKPKPLTGKVALVTGSGGGIGKAIAARFAEEGACVVLNDVDETRLEACKATFVEQFGADKVLALPLDVTNSESIQKALEATCRCFGGLDILVNNAGISISEPLTSHSEAQWAAARIMRTQEMGGDILNIVSKNAVVAGPNNAGYGSAKAAQAHLTRLLAAELGPDRIRVNSINPDAVIQGSNIWSGGWAEGRAKAYGISVEELPAFYAKRTLLNEIILPEDIANACFVFVSGYLNKSTGNALNVDGGVPMGFLR